MKNVFPESGCYVLKEPSDSNGTKISDRHSRLPSVCKVKTVSDARLGAMAPENETLNAEDAEIIASLQVLCVLCGDSQSKRNSSVYGCGGGGSCGYEPG